MEFTIALEFRISIQLFKKLIPHSLLKWSHNGIIWYEHSDIFRKDGEAAIHMKKDPIYKSFGYAFRGIRDCIVKERSIKIHLTMTALVILAGIFFRISVLEWIACLILFALVISLEIINTAIEAVVDLACEEKKPLARLAKDAAAGAVLVSAIFAAIIGLIIFIPKLLAFLA